MNADILLDVLRSEYKDILHHEVSQCLISFLVACTIAVTSIPVIINFCDLLNLKEIPNYRSAHKDATPKFGGVAIFAGVLIGHFLWPHFNDQGSSYLTNLSVVGITILFFLGMKDDLLMLDPSKKLLLQIVAASTLVFLGGLKVDNMFGIFGYFEVSDWFSIPFTIFIFIALINAINLIDGIDGLAGGVGFIASICFGTWFLLNHHYSIACLAFSMAGGLLGFLRFNFSNTSKIFMGDTGSLIVGFLLAFFAVEFIRINATFLKNPDPESFLNAPIFAVVLLIVPIFDTLRVFVVRVLNGRSPFHADRNHMHHVFIDNGMSHLQATMTLCGATVIHTVAYSYTFKDYTNTEAVAAIVGLFLLYMTTGYFLKMRAYRLKHSLNWGQVWDLANYSKASLAKRVIRNL
jgi:UDP-N-acetylmuramyl pentapeptide phosphotransferase/UDP-N-acetylglucosamine-1-phosphate transferase